MYSCPPVVPVGAEYAPTLRFDTLEDYLDHVGKQPGELAELQRHLLISVSSFLRDPMAFEALQAALRCLIAGKREGDSIRVWVTACATGEETYSVAILLGEILGERLSRFEPRVYGTDIDAEALETARAGVYAEEDLAP